MSQHHEAKAAESRPHACAAFGYYHESAVAPLHYEAFHYPLQQPAAAAEERLERFLTAASFHDDPTLLIPQLPSPPPPQQHAQRCAMALPGEAVTDEELADLQKLSNEYEPKATGPLVGQRQPSTAITTEYQSADPVLQAKTSALPHKYSHYRTVRGDGGCGWRAIAFGYFEVLLRLGDGDEFIAEETRLRSLSNLLDEAGLTSYLYEDFAEETFELLRKVAAALPAGNAENVLLDSFNDDAIQNYIIAYIKMLTTAWMKTREQEYRPWLLDQTVDEYTNTQVQPTGSEIEHVSLMALKDVLLSPAGVTLEVHYLDRSEGEEVNMHRFSPVTRGGYDTGTVRLLYRPGHYDLLYKIEDLPLVQSSMPTFMQFASHPHEDPVCSLANSDLLAMIPGFSLAFPEQSSLLDSAYAQVFPQPSAASTAFQPTIPNSTVEPPDMPSRVSGQRGVPYSSRAHQDVQSQADGPFRPSAWAFEPELINTALPPPTDVFKNSHYNRCHFLNDRFQPELWHPDHEPSIVKRRRRRSHSR